MSFEQIFDTTTDIVILGILIAVLVQLVLIYIGWLIIKSAVRCGTAEAIQETLIDSGILTECQVHDELTDSE